MACTNDKFVINKGMSNEFILTIKENGTTTAMVIDPSDTFEMQMYLLDTDELVETITMTDVVDKGVITIESEAGGQIKITLHTAFVESLISERGDRADYYYEKPTYRIALDCTTVNNGTFVAKIEKVYVS